MKLSFKRIWNFVWHDNSVWSWIVNIVLAFVLVKFIIYPGIGLLFGTGYPVVAVVSGSMVHDGSFDSWWEEHKDFYLAEEMTKEDISFFKGGFNKGDIMVVFGKKADKISIGDVIVYEAGKSYPIIHRVINKWDEEGITYFKTKGDHNKGFQPFEKKIHEDKLLGKAYFRIPLLGWVKIGFTELMSKLGVVVR